MKILYLFALLLVGNVLIGQNVCGTFSPQDNPEKFSAQQLQTRDLLETKLLLSKQLPADASRGGMITIPVVVHIIHLGESEGSGTNLSNSTVQYVIDEMNNSLRNANGNSTDMQVEVCLATVDPQGNQSNGITRANGSSITGYDTDGISHGTGCPTNDEQVKELNQWPHQYYINIWVVNDICPPGVAGYAQFPWSYNSDYDGIVVTYTSFQNLETPIHELGHILGLYHTHQGDDSGNSCPTDNDCLSDGDKCCDTEPHKRDDCSTNSCTGQGNWTDTRFNIMSYCSTRDRFTGNQKDRVQFYLTDPSTAIGGLSASYGCGANFIPASLAYANHAVDDDNSSSVGDGDGLVEPGEKIELDVQLYNYGQLAALNVVAELSTTDPHITITGATRPYNDIAGGAYKWSPDFVFEVSDSCPEKDVVFNLALSCSTGTWTESFVVHVHTPVVSGVQKVSASAINVFPNPGNGRFVISGLLKMQTPLTVSVFDPLGRKVFSKQESTSAAENIEVNLGDVATGIYLVKIATQDGEVTSKVSIINY